MPTIFVPFLHPATFSFLALHLVTVAYFPFWLAFFMTALSKTLYVSSLLFRKDVQVENLQNSQQYRAVTGNLSQNYKFFLRTRLFSRRFVIWRPAGQILLRRQQSYHRKVHKQMQERERTASCWYFSLNVLHVLHSYLELRAHVPLK